MSANILLLAALIGVATCYPTGPPPTACGDMHPHHKANKSDSLAPYVITVSQTTYKEKDTIMVTVNGSVPFKGFFLQMRSTDMSKMDQMGSFMIPINVTNIAYVNCTAGSQSAVSHNNNTKKMSVTVQWNAPTGNMGDLNIRATVVKNVTVFWEGVLSDAIKYTGNSTAATTGAMPTGTGVMTTGTTGNTTGTTGNATVTTAAPSLTTSSAGASLPSLLLMTIMSSVVGFVARR